MRKLPGIEKRLAAQFDVTPGNAGTDGVGTQFDRERG